MPVLPQDLVAPKGKVEPALFPGEYEEGNNTLLTRVTEYVSEATTKVAALNFGGDTDKEDAAVAAWAYYRIFQAAYTLSLTRPAEEDARTEVLGRVLYEEDQRAGLKELMDTYFEEWLAATAEVIDSTQTLATGTPTHSTPVTYEY